MTARVSIKLALSPESKKKFKFFWAVSRFIRGRASKESTRRADKTSRAGESILQSPLLSTTCDDISSEVPGGLAALCISEGETASPVHVSKELSAAATFQ
jgi:hypothetical protein